MHSKISSIAYNYFEHTVTEVINNAYKNHIGMHRMQAEKLQHYEEQKERYRAYRNEQVLQILQETHTS